jgi:hypothetical protein
VSLNFRSKKKSEVMVMQVSSVQMYIGHMIQFQMNMISVENICFNPRFLILYGN